jgi:competence protein ComEC
LTFLSFISIVVNEFSYPTSFPLFVGQEVWVDLEHREIIVESLHVLKPSEEKKNHDITLVYFLKDGSRQNLEYFSLVLSPLPVDSLSNALDSHLVSGVVKNIVLPDKDGPWWQRNLYIKRQSAQLDIRFDKDDLDALQVKEVTPRQWLSERLDQAMGDFSTWRFSKALLLGENKLWSERDTWIVRTLGLAHLFVVSGLHTGFMFVIGRFISRCVWQFFPSRLLLSGVTRWHCDVFVILPLLLGYAYITHWGEPVVRASIMLSIYLCARMLALKASAYGIITFALWLVLLVEPRSILSPGLWLSFSMVYLLIGFCQLSSKFSRLIMLQVMLSTASMVLILGWQEGISSLSILVNILLIPLAGFVWFPWGIVACLEVLILGSTYSYYLLDRILEYLEYCLEWIAFNIPIFYFDEFSSAMPRIIMLFLILYWVYQSPLKRGVVNVLAIWFVLFSPMILEINKADYRLMNKENTLVLKDKNAIVLTDAWFGGDINGLMFNEYLVSNLGKSLILSPNPVSVLSPQVLLKYKIDWVILKRAATIKQLDMFDALQVDRLVISSGEFLDVYFQNNSIKVRHSACIYSFFLLKSDTCKRVEKLESVLNY